MKRLLIFTLILAPLIVYNQTFFTFFAQDDFILIEEFSQNNIIQDLKNSFGLPKVTHWRPMHNLFFLISGNIFSQNFAAYHLITFIVHLTIGYLIFLTTKFLYKTDFVSFAASIIYVVHPAHLVTLNWISGSATSIGFLLLLSSFYFFIKKRLFFALIFFLLSLLASEAMVAGFLLFFIYSVTTRQANYYKNALIFLFLISLVYTLAKFLWLIPASTFTSYQIIFGLQIFSVIKFYLLRILGFAEVSGDFTASLVLSGWIIFIVILLFIKKDKMNLKKELIFPISAFFAGLFPFIFLPSQLSAHYMNVSVFAFGTFVAILLNKIDKRLAVFLLFFFIIVAFYNVQVIRKDHWSTKRSLVAKSHVDRIKAENLLAGSRLIFDNSHISTSYEAYISLGTGKAIDFFFKDRGYTYCFIEFEDCN